MVLYVFYTQSIIFNKYIHKHMSNYKFQAVGKPKYVIVKFLNSKVG